MSQIRGKVENALKDKVKLTIGQVWVVVVHDGMGTVNYTFVVKS